MCEKEKVWEEGEGRDEDKKASHGRASSTSTLKTTQENVVSVESDQSHFSCCVDASHCSQPAVKKTGKHCVIF